MLYVGVDAHKSTSQITVMNEAGVILRRKSVNSTSEVSREPLPDSMSRSRLFLKRATAGDQCTTGSMT
jgi:hypothetical protein